MKEIFLSEYTYSLPDDRIALYPLANRINSKLLLSKQKTITHDLFKNIGSHLPKNATLFFNNTKVIPARLQFTKDTGARIEVFLLAPLLPSALHALAMEAQHQCTWSCAIGNLKRWSDNTILTQQVDNCMLKATLVDRQKGTVQFSWTGNQHFAEVIMLMGKVPLPPYINRNAEESDTSRYQTVYSVHAGAVAAPTAGLHFSTEIVEELKHLGIQTDFLTLHVSAGTFQPIKSELASEHVMHNEQMVLTMENIDSMLSAEFIIPVGTTSMRTLESTYWYGVKLLQNPDADFSITQHDPYQPFEWLPTAKEAIHTVKNYMIKKNVTSITGDTSIFIMPGYVFKMCKGLITNFHQPGSTLILLVAAFMGEHWRDIYQSALNNDYRFLSYGDSSLLIP